MKNTILNIITQDKLILTNGALLGLSLTNIEMILKIILLTTSIIWTGIKVYNELKKKHNERKD